MKFLIEKESLLRLVQVSRHFVSSRNPLPILSGILIELKDHTLSFLATDLEMGIRCSIPVDGIENGSIVLPAYQFSELVQKLPEVPVEISTSKEDNGALIKYGSSEAYLYGFSSDEFPSLPACEGSSFSIREDIFKDMLRKVLFAVGTNEKRPLFTGVLMELKDKSISLTASDTHRLSMYSSELDNLVPQTDVIIPGKALSEVSRLLGGDDNELSIFITDNQIFFSFSNLPFNKRDPQGGQMMVMSRLIEGKFPDFSGAIPKEFSAVVEVLAEDLMDAVERASLLLQGNSKVIELRFSREKILISSQTEAGRIYEETPATLEGEETTIYFNARYLIDLLKVIERGTILIYLSGPRSGSIVKIKNNDGFKSLILPVRKSNDF